MVTKTVGEHQTSDKELTTLYQGIRRSPHKRRAHASEFCSPVPASRMWWSKRFKRSWGYKITFLDFHAYFEPAVADLGPKYIFERQNKFQLFVMNFKWLYSLRTFSHSLIQLVCYLMFEITKAQSSHILPMCLMDHIFKAQKEEVSKVRPWVMINKGFFLFLLYVRSFVCMYFYASCPSKYPWRQKDGIQIPRDWNYRQLQTPVRVLGIKLKSAIGAPNALNHWPISLATNIIRLFSVID